MFCTRGKACRKTKFHGLWWNWKVRQICTFKNLTDIIPSFKILMFLIFELKLMKISLCGKSFILVIYWEKRKREVVGSGYDSDYSECFRPLLWLFWSNKLGWSPIEDHPSLFDPIWWFRWLMMTRNISFFWWFCPYWIFLRLMPDLNISENNTSESADEAPLWS